MMFYLHAGALMAAMAAAVVGAAQSPPLLNAALNPAPPSPELPGTFSCELNLTQYMDPSGPFKSETYRY